MAGWFGSQSAGQKLRVQEFRSSGTFTVPTGVKTVNLFAVGAGGGASNIYGLGAGGQIVETTYDVNGKTTCAVLIGAGAAASTGGNTSFDGVVVAAGGEVNGAYSSSTSTAATTHPAGKYGFGGHGISSGNNNLRNGQQNGARLAGPVANTGAGAGESATVAGASGYLRVEWFE